MKKLWRLSYGLLVMLVLQMVAPTPFITAQGGDDCQLDLVETITTLVRVQHQADRGDPFQAITSLTEIQRDLATLLEACTGERVPLGADFTSPDRRLGFSYPENWTLRSPETNVYFLANEPEIIDQVLTDNFERLAPQAQLLAFVLSPMDEIFSRATDFETFVAYFKEDGMGSQTPLTGPISSFQLSSYTGHEFIVNGEDINGFAALVNLNDGWVLMILGLSASGEAEAIAPIFKSVLQSTQLSPQSGNTCDLNLVETIVALLEAQRFGDGGALLEGVNRVEQAQQQVSTLLKICDKVGLPLGGRFESPDGMFRFRYPAGWVVANPESDVYIMTNDMTTDSDSLATAWSEGLGGVSPDVRMIVFMLDSLNEVGGVAIDLEKVVETLVVDKLQVGLKTQLTLTGSTSSAPVNGYDARMVTIAGESVAGFAYLINFGERALITLGLTGQDEGGDLAWLSESVLKSVRYGSRGLRPPGQSLIDLNYVEAIPIGELVADASASRSAVLAPDGTAVAWLGSTGGGNSICLYRFATVVAETTCTNIPKALKTRPTWLLWSPDSKYIAFNEDMFRYFVEPDIWLFEVASERIINRTDDDIQGDFLLRQSDQHDPVWADHTLTWGEDGALYFIRYEIFDRANRDNAATGLYRLAPAEDTVELVRDLTSYLARFTIYYQSEYVLDGPLAISPDGEKMAFLVQEAKLNAPSNGLWVLDLSNDTAPEHLVRLQDFQPGLPDYSLQQADFAIPIGLAWGHNSEQLYLLAGTLQTQNAPTGIAYALYLIDVATGQLIPLTDASHLEMDALLAPDRTTGYQGVYTFPRTAVMSPDGTTPLVFKAESSPGRAGLYAATLDDDRGELQLLYEFDDYQGLPGPISSVASDGKVLMHGYLFIPQKIE